MPRSDSYKVYPVRTLPDNFSEESSDLHRVIAEDMRLSILMIQEEIRQVKDELGDTTEQDNQINAIITRLSNLNDQVARASIQIPDVQQLPTELSNKADISYVQSYVGQVAGPSAPVTATYKIHSMPSTYTGSTITSYCGFATDLTALTSEAKWAVKKVLQDGTETWAGKTTFDQILDNYLSLTYI